MLGRLIASLDEPETVARLLAHLDAPTLQDRILQKARLADRPPADFVAGTVRGFLDTASDEDWLQLVGIMGRAADPGLAAMRAILEHALPAAETKP